MFRVSWRYAEERDCSFCTEFICLREPISETTGNNEEDDFTMSKMPKIFYEDSIVFEFLLSMARLNCDEMIRGIHKQHPFRGHLKEDKEISKWVSETWPRLPDDIKELMNVFFSCESFFGLSFLPDIVQHEIRSTRDFMKYVSGLSEKEILRHFFNIVYCPELRDRSSLEVDEVIEKLSLDDKETLMFISQSTFYSASEKAKLFDFFTSREKMKEDFTYLLQWYNENVFSEIEEHARKKQREALEQLKENVDKGGMNYLKDMQCYVSQLHYLRAKEIRLGASAYIGAGKTVFGRKHAEMPAETLIIYGHERLPFPFATRDSMEKVAQTFSPLSNVNTIKVLREVLGQRKLLVDVVRQTKLAIKEVSDHISSLESAKLVRTYIEDGEYYVEADIEKVSKIVNNALEKVLKIEAEE